VRQVLLVFGEAQAKPAGYCLQAAGDRFFVDVFRNICGMDDLRQTYESRLFQFVFEHDGLERTAPILMAKFHAGSIEGDGVLLFGDLLNLVLGNKEELGIVVDEAGDEPGTSNAINVHV
jgi:hypothetical protein